MSARSSNARAAAPRPSALGMEVRPITPEVARQLNLRTNEGVIVSRVDEGTSAAEAGIQRGDVIREINRQKVRNLADYERFTREAKDGDRLTVLLQRGPDVALCGLHGRSRVELPTLHNRASQGPVTLP